MAADTAAFRVRLQRQAVLPIYLLAAAAACEPARRPRLKLAYPDIAETHRILVILQLQRLFERV